MSSRCASHIGDLEKNQVQSKFPFSEVQEQIHLATETAHHWKCSFELWSLIGFQMFMFKILVELLIHHRKIGRYPCVTWCKNRGNRSCLILLTQTGLVAHAPNEGWFRGPYRLPLHLGILMTLFDIWYDLPSLSSIMLSHLLQNRIGYTLEFGGMKNIKKLSFPSFKMR